MRTLHVGLRVGDMDRSLVFYTAVGYEVVGHVEGTPIGDLAMLKLADDEFVTIELVHDASVGGESTGTGLSHLVIKVESMEATIADLTGKGLDVEEPTSPDDSENFLTSWITDPDGNRIELVQWAPGHADGITAADAAD